MRILKTMLSVIMMVSISFSLDITISGKVTDTGTTHLPNAAVKLEKYDLTATTDINGNFTLTGAVDINNNNNKLQNNKLSVRLGNGVLFLDLRERGLVEIATYTLIGKAVSKKKQFMDIGTHRITQTNIGNGVYLYRIKSGSSELLLKSHSIGRVFEKTAVSDKGGSSSTVSAKIPRHILIDDVIAVTKDGYLNYRVIVTNSDTSNIEIKMIVCADTVRDIDGNLYQAVRIGNQVWTVENLRVTRYNDGTPIPLDTSSTSWHETTPKFCYWIKKFGALYNWYVVSPANPPKIAPVGWHVPTNAEWIIMENYLIANGYNYDGTTTDNKIAKSLAARTDWYKSEAAGATGNDLTKNNKSGFTALGGGYRSYNGYFLGFGNYGNLWSATEYNVYSAYHYGLNSGYLHLYEIYDSKNCGFFLRLVRD